MLSWHAEIYSKMLNKIITGVGEDHCLDGCPEWELWLEKTYPEHFKKYTDAGETLVRLWGDMTPSAMEEFKAAVKIELEATEWAVAKVMEENRTIQTSSAPEKIENTANGEAVLNTK